MADDLTFVINPEYETASFGLLLKSFEDIRRLLRDVDRAIYGPKSARDWAVRKLGSSAPTITVNPEFNGQGAPEAIEATEAVGDGLRAVTTGTDQPPRYFSEQALVDLGKMKRLFTGRSKARSIAVFVNGHQMATIRPDISVKVNRILTASYLNRGSLQGTLEAINVHGTPTVTIWDRVSRLPVRCSIPRNPDWFSRVKGLLEKRVTVTGEIHYFINGTPRSIRAVTDIEDATPATDLPKAGFGSIPDMHVRELGAAQWLNSIRDGAMNNDG